VKFVDAHLLMLTLNERLSLANGIQLRMELEEHDLNLDGVIARVQEAGLRLGIQQVLAFHATGITDADLQAAIAIVQDYLLYRVVNKI